MVAGVAAILMIYGGILFIAPQVVSTQVRETTLAAGKVYPLVAGKVADCRLTLGGPSDGYVVAPIAPRQAGSDTAPSVTCLALRNLAGKHGRLAFIEEQP